LDHFVKRLKKEIAGEVSSGAAAVTAAGITLALALAAESVQEKNSLEYARYEIDGAGRAGDNVRLVFLTDLHEKSFGEGNRDLLEMIDRADPDAILIGGDMPIAGRGISPGSLLRGRSLTSLIPGNDMTDPVPGRAYYGVSLALCRELARKYEVFYGNGNHEQRIVDRTYFDRLEDMGVTYLSNRTVHWKYNISITGLNLGPAQYKPVIPEAPDLNYIDRRVGVLDDERFNILLAHSPQFIRSYAATGADLVLSGHFHGGTVRLPGDVGLMTPQYQLFSTNVTGRKRYGSTDMVISSGLGTHSINIRINDKPQVVVVDIKK